MAIKVYHAQEDMDLTVQVADTDESTLDDATDSKMTFYNTNDSSSTKHPTGLFSGLLEISSYSTGTAGAFEKVSLFWRPTMTETDESLRPRWLPVFMDKATDDGVPPDFERMTDVENIAEDTPYYIYLSRPDYPVSIPLLKMGTSASDKEIQFKANLKSAAGGFGGTAETVFTFDIDFLWESVI